MSQGKYGLEKGKLSSDLIDQIDKEVASSNYRKLELSFRSLTNVGINGIFVEKIWNTNIPISRMPYLAKGATKYWMINNGVVELKSNEPEFSFFWRGAVAAFFALMSIVSAIIVIASHSKDFLTVAFLMFIYALMVYSLSISLLRVEHFCNAVFILGERSNNRLFDNMIMKRNEKLSRV